MLMEQGLLAAKTGWVQEPGAAKRDQLLPPVICLRKQVPPRVFQGLNPLLALLLIFFFQGFNDLSVDQGLGSLRESFGLKSNLY